MRQVEADSRGTIKWSRRECFPLHFTKSQNSASLTNFTSRTWLLQRRIPLFSMTFQQQADHGRLTRTRQGRTTHIFDSFFNVSYTTGFPQGYVELQGHTLSCRVSFIPRYRAKIQGVGCPTYFAYSPYIYIAKYALTYLLWASPIF